MLTRFYRIVADRLNYFPWGRTLLAHLRRHQSFYGNAEAIFVAFLTVIIIKAYIFEPFKIPSDSMSNTLLEGDHIILNKFIYRFRDIEVGDIVVFKVPEDIPHYDPNRPYYIKRVVGLPGDRIEIQNDKFIYNHNKRLDDSDIFKTNYYYSELTDEPYEFKPVNVKEGEVLVFGDNSADSYDSRYWGSVPMENIIGKAFFRYWPVSPWRVGLIRDEARTAPADTMYP